MSSKWKLPFQKKKRERQQPSEREHLGFLEKKKDYLARAKIKHKQEQKIQTLRRAAQLHNPEEFHFAMITDVKNRDQQQTVTKPLAEFSKDQRLLLKTRGPEYIQSKIVSNNRKIEALKLRIPKPRTAQLIFSSVEEAIAYQKAHPESNQPEEEVNPNVLAIQEEIEKREAMNAKLQEVLDEIQLQKDLKDGTPQQLEDEEGERYYVWKSERKR